jgi:hypothetical protein
VNKLKLAKMTMALLVVGLPAHVVLSSKRSCKCSPAAASDQTNWGNGNVIIKKEQLFKSLRGTIIAAGDLKPLAGVLVEVYDKPEGLLMDFRERESRKAKQRRIAACITGADGQFCFDNIPFGKYELRSSKPIEWNPTSVYVVVDPKNPRSVRSKLTIDLHLSH